MNSCKWWHNLWHKFWQVLAQFSHELLKHYASPLTCLPPILARFWRSLARAASERLVKAVDVAQGLAQQQGLAQGLDGAGPSTLHKASCTRRASRSAGPSAGLAIQLGMHHAVSHGLGAASRPR
jgi:hypothetical protein